MNANARAQELIDLSHSMVQVMATETEVLRQGKVSEMEVCKHKRNPWQASTKRTCGMSRRSRACSIQSNPTSAMR